jgi:methyl-accepting chemotaxis protein
MSWWKPAETSQTGSGADGTAELRAQIAAINRSLAVIEFKMDGTILTANDNFLAIVGYRLDEVVGKHHSLFADEATRASAGYRQFWEKLNRGEFDKAQYRRVAKGGREVWLEATYNPVMGADGRPVKVIKIATDITRQKAESLLNAALKNSLNAATAKIMATDNEFNIIYVNNAATELMTTAQADVRAKLPNFDASRLLGSNIDLFHQRPGHQRSMLTDMRGTMQSEVVVGGRTLGLTASPMFDERGARLGTVMEWVDKTEALHIERELESVVAAVVGGDMGQRVSLEGKTGFFAALSIKINDLIASFADVVGNVKLAAEEVARGVQEISQGNVDLSSRTEAQASSLEETASSMEEMTASVRQNADNSGQANQLAVAARDQADRGGAVVAKAVKAMSEINQSSKKIADIIGVIDEIAFQTNLLALNAAVEAARAGEQGRGFAVVASEVRNLAGRSATAAKEIKDLIRDSVQRVEEGSTLVVQSGQTLEQIVSAVKRVSDIIAEIAASSQEQSSGIEQVNKAVMQLDEMTQQNAALVEQATAASRSMADQSAALSQALAKFGVTGTPGKSARPALPAKAKATPRAPARSAARPGAATAAASSAASSTAPQPKKAVGDDSAWTQF